MIARKAVGAVKKTRTRCCSMARQKGPASGVPTGAYTMQECPATQPTSDAVQNTSSGFTP